MNGIILAAVSFLMSIVAVIFVIVCIMLVLVILIQKGRGGGLGAALGGTGAAGLLGTKTGDFLTWVTIAVTALFLSIAIIMGLFYKPTITEPQVGQTRPAVPSQPVEDVDRREAAPPIPSMDAGTEQTNTDAQE